MGHQGRRMYRSFSQTHSSSRKPSISIPHHSQESVSGGGGRADGESGSSPTPFGFTRRHQRHSSGRYSRLSVFNDLDAHWQYRILNQLMHRESGNDASILFSSLPAPVAGTVERGRGACEGYLEELSTLVQDLPPILLVHAKSMSMTTAL
ncbi:hypothetical protein BJ684DRAFT_20869 [Piptocephalis cylindrospora]|uniref:SLC12A transporter C-terminal domain-containing protein n=1 Tax=Piptocephalis cylindrospora TaxID=1907219 RepID=A0A4V1IXX7_9FUNG|nr:hypothetical protein BJ684DRAFT_20869 [Piptocephalis cylindrospora]|eukprot:RKP12599.1 hypothetical protein BJ684DRAFT_20869 [Piptocephalis cylindrospora]